jgi:hypothetical protein
VRSDFQYAIEQNKLRSIVRAVGNWSLEQCKHWVWANDLDYAIAGLGDNELRYYVVECIFEIWYAKIENAGGAQ